MSKRKITTEEFIARCQEVHGSKYDYSKFIYVSRKTKSTIICPVHNYEFSQIAERHLAGAGCQKCGVDRTRLTLQEFLDKAAALHGEKFDYSKVKYINTYTKVIIICKIHGEFLQKPNSHLSGLGCAACAKDGKIVSIDEQIERANIFHQSKYDYSLIDKENYKGTHQKLPIICPSHGVFWQRLGLHVSAGNGCRFCHSSKLEMKVAGFLNLHKIRYKREKTFPDCKNPSTGKHLRYAFYLPDPSVLCELQGLQHYIPTSFGSDRCPETKQKNFENIQYRDAIKAEYAAKNNIKLIAIHYKDIDRIPEILDRELFGINQDTISYDSSPAIKQAA
jgi:ferredoxin-like protein FixX